MIIVKQFRFDSAHKLNWHNGKCKNLHGHTYKLRVAVEGNIKKNGIVIDFYELSTIVKEKIISKLDHTNLNEKMNNPTAENISIWIWNELKPHLNLYEIILWETPDSYAIYKGDNS